MNYRFASLALGLAAASFLGACVVQSSSDPATSSKPVAARPLPTSSTLQVGQLSASLSAQSDGQSIKIYAGVFFNDRGYGNRAVVLEDGDYFSAQIAGSEPLVLIREVGTKDDVAHYTGTLPEQSAAVDVIIAFNRPAGKLSAPASKLHLPAPFQLTSTAPSTVHRGDLVPIRLAPSTDKLLSIDVTTADDCLEIKSSTLTSFLGFDANGSASFDTARLVLKSGASSCPISIQVRALTNGDIDPAFVGGVSGLGDDAEGLQARSFATTLIP